ncbi:sce7726 family protein [Janthinobacterium sp. RT4P48]|uniref:sce7726 family protein n=1 Tax=Janthinobacterium sp. RT4P48 TaxID=3424188 RepID=UPI003F24195F
MQKLTDKEIRQALLVHLGRRAKPPRATLEEVHVCNGNAIADVVAVYKTMHCYEIKGETDSINRIVRQSQYYDQAFPLITLVTTVNHLKRAEVIVPKHWGIMLANSTRNNSVTFKHVRGVTRNPSYLPEIALLSLWRSELIKFPNFSSPLLEKMNRQRIAELIASSVPTSAINEIVGQALTARSSKNSTLDNPSPCIQYERRLLASESLKG